MASSGDTLSFKEVLLRSTALNRLLESYLSAPNPEDAARLGSLFLGTAHPTIPEPFCKDLAEATLSLGSLLAKDPLSPSSDAKKALNGALLVLKEGIKIHKREVETPIEHFSKLQISLAVDQATATKAIHVKDQLRLWDIVLTNLMQQIDLTISNKDCSPSMPPEIKAALEPLQCLRTSLQNRLSFVQSRGHDSIADQIAEANATYESEDAAVQMKAKDIEAEIRVLEDRLAALKDELSQIGTTREQAALQHSKIIEALTAHGANFAANAACITSGLEVGVKCIEQLETSLTSTFNFGATAGRMDTNERKHICAGLVAANAPDTFIAAINHVQETGLLQLSELAQKAKFFRERLMHSDRQAAELKMLALADAKTAADHRKHKASLEKMLQDVLTSTSITASLVTKAYEAFRMRKRAVTQITGYKLPSDFSASEFEKAKDKAIALERSIITGGELLRAEEAPNVLPTTPCSDILSLEERLAQLEEENRRKDAQIAEMLANTTPSLSSPSPLKDTPEASPQKKLNRRRNDKKT